MVRGLGELVSVVNVSDCLGDSFSWERFVRIWFDMDRKICLWVFDWLWIVVGIMYLIIVLRGVR